MEPNRAKPMTRHKRGVVAVILRDERMLIIRRSLTVTAPGKLCLPGGTIEKGETEQEALVREMQEELNINIAPIQLCWQSVTSWGTHLSWWHADLPEDQTPIPNPDEVAEVFWYSRDDMRSAADSLPSLPEFLTAWESGGIDVKQTWK